MIQFISKERLNRLQQIGYKIINKKDITFPICCAINHDNRKVLIFNALRNWGIIFKLGKEAVI